MTTLQESTQHSLIAGAKTPGHSGSVRAVNPATGDEIGPEFTLLDPAQLTAATEAAATAFTAYRSLSPEARAAFLATAAARIEARGEQVIATARTETGLAETRLRGELVRTVNQLRLFAGVAAAGDHLGVRIEPALGERQPVPRPDLRQVKVPLGPVGVFGASNFPLAFSVAGGDTASALAAGCPVVVKAHNAHPGTGQLVGQALNEAVAEHQLPSGVFSLVYGPGVEIGQALVKDERIKAIGFTGSRRGGLSIVEAANARPEPIPVYAEMSSVNPIFILPSALRGDLQAIAEGFVTSLNGSAGQLCTAAGLLFVPMGEEGDDLVQQIKSTLAVTQGQTMLSPGICSARRDGEDRLSAIAGVSSVARGAEGDGANAPAAALYSTDVDTFLSSPTLAEEIFGAVSLIVRYRDLSELPSVVDGMEGQLTATLHLNAEELDDAAAAKKLLPHLEQRAGRILINGWPTGVDVGDAIVHGGPFPATSDGRSTSVGTLAVDRFLRPVVYQNLPAVLQPAAVQDNNPWQLVRRVNGEYRLR